MTGIEGPAIGVGARLAAAGAREFFKTTEFERLCGRLAGRFSDQLPYTSADFALWSRDEAFAAALGKYTAPPHEFDKPALIAAITPLVGPLDQDVSAEALAAMISEAIGEELRMAKSGDALVRFETDRLVGAISAERDARRTQGSSTSAPAPEGIFWSRVDALTPTDFGVTPLDPSFGSKLSWGPKFPRTIDGEIEKALAAGIARTRPSMIVLAGPSGAGKSRAVSDALLQRCPAAQIAIPDGATSLGRALDHGVLTAEIPVAGRILLLDDLELFVSPEGLTAQRLAALKRDRGALVIVATAGGKGPRLLGELEREIRGSHLSSLRPLWDLTIRVDVCLTEGEIARSRMSPSEMERLREHGLVWLTGAPRLLEKLSTGCQDPASVPNRPGQQLAQLVLEWHSYGLPAGIPERALRSLLLEREPSLSEQEVDGALRWALRPVDGEIALVHQVRGAHQMRFEADDFLRGEEIWFHDDEFDLDRWRQVTRFATAPQRLELLDRQRPSIVPREVGLDELQEELVRDGAGEELLTQLEAVRAAMLDGMLAVLWETAPEWSEEEADGKLALIAECSGPYIEAIELAAAGDHPEGLQELARLCVPRGSREQEHYYRRAFDEAVKAGALAGGHAFADPLVSIARAQHARGEMAAMAETCQAAAALAGESGAEPAATTCRVLYAVAEAGEKLDLDELEVSVGHGADWEQLAAHFLELGNPEFAIRLARIASFDSKGTEARCLVQMGQFERAMELTAEGEVTVDGQCFLADVLSFVGRFKDQLATLLRAFTVAEEDERARAEGRRYKFDDKVTLEAREVDAGLLIEAAHGGELAEAFYRERLDVNSRLVAFLADLLMREGQMQEAMSLLDSRQFFPSCLWGRAVVLDWQRLDSPSASIAPWDQRMARVEVPGYREATRRIASHAAERGEPVAIAMLLCEACLHHRWGQATELIEKAMAVPPKPARSAVDQAVIGIEFPPATEYLWRAGELLKDAGRLDAAKAVWELCRRDGLAEAMFELGLATQAQDPPKSLVYFKEAAARFHPEVLRI